MNTLKLLLMSDDTAYHDLDYASLYPQSMVNDSELNIAKYDVCCSENSISKVADDTESINEYRTKQSNDRDPKIILTLDETKYSENDINNWSENEQYFGIIYGPERSRLRHMSVMISEFYYGRPHGVWYFTPDGKRILVDEVSSNPEYIDERAQKGDIIVLVGKFFGRSNYWAV